MAERPNAVGNVLKNPLIVGLIFLFVILVVAFIANFYLGEIAAGRNAAQLKLANNLKVASQQVGKDAAAIAGGRVEAFVSLASNRDKFESSLASLRQTDTTAVASGVSRVASSWDAASAQLDVVISSREAIQYLRDLTSDLAISMSAIQQENNKIVAALLRLGAPANEIALAQRQNLLIERMARAADRMVDVSASDNVDAAFNRDSREFRRVLNGFMGGDRELLLDAATDQEVRASLARVEELFRSITARSNEILARAEEVVQGKRAAQLFSVESDTVLDASEALTAAIENKSGFGLGSPLLTVGAAALAFIIIFLVSMLIYREASRSVRESAVQNEQNQAAILQLLDELADLADGDLRVQATVTESFTGAIADSINFSIDQMRGLVSKINQTSSEVRSAAEDTKSSVSELSDASQQQAKEIADVSEAVNEMAVSIDQVSYNAAESSSVAERSVDIASKGAVVVQNTIDGMDKIRGQIQETAKRIKRLGESSQEIGDIVSLINDIADQTNILSLNAAIQASMAGDAGKGFAVVADEVQRLAERSGAAAKQISALVKTIQSDTNEAVTSMEQTTAEVVQGTRLAQDAGVALGEIESVSKSLAEIIENISDAARQQAASAGKISNTMKSIQEITSQTTEGTRGTVIAVGNLADMTNELRSSVTGFKLPG